MKCIHGVDSADREIKVRHKNCYACCIEEDANTALRTRLAEAEKELATLRGKGCHEEVIEALLEAAKSALEKCPFPVGSMATKKKLEEAVRMAERRT